MLRFVACALAAAASVAADGRYPSELWEDDPGDVAAAELSRRSPLPGESRKRLKGALPKAFTWDAVDGKSYLTKALNQQ